MENSLLFGTYKLGRLNLKNRIVMAPMTRSRALGNVPNELMAIYYKQRSDAGLVITEGTSPSPNGLGHPNMPGIYNQQQIEGWRKVTNIVHTGGAKIFVQLMHTGRIAHEDNLPKGARILSASSIKAEGQLPTPEGKQNYPVPQPMSIEDIQFTIQEYAQAARNAIKAGFDGVELHSANGYLLEQFINPNTNVRTDEYGGSIENRCRFVVEVGEAVAEAIGREKVGIRFSPYGVLNNMSIYDGIEQTYLYLAKQMERLELCYIHVVDHSSTGTPEVKESVKENIRRNFDGSYIMSGGYNKNKAEMDLESDKGDLVAFGRAFVSNPDLVERFENNWPLEDNIHYDLLYTSGEEGYIDYPSFAEEFMYV